MGLFLPFLLTQAATILVLFPLGNFLKCPLRKTLGLLQELFLTARLRPEEERDLDLEAERDLDLRDFFTQADLTLMVAPDFKCLICDLRLLAQLLGDLLRDLLADLGDLLGDLAQLTFLKTFPLGLLTDLR